MKQEQVKKLTGLIKTVDIAFNAPLEKGQSKFFCKAKVTGESFIALQKVFINHSVINNYMRELIAKEPNIAKDKYIEKINAYIKNTGLYPNIQQAVNNEAHYTHKKFNDKTLKEPTKFQYLSYGNDSGSVTDFTLLNSRDKIYLEGIDVVLRLSNKVPEEIISTYDYLNISCGDIDRMDTLQVSLHGRQ